MPVGLVKNSSPIPTSIELKKETQKTLVSTIISIILEISKLEKMKLEDAAETLAQLGNPTRLEVVRYLVKAGPSGVPVGSIQRQLKIPASTLTHHLKHLKGVGLLMQKREKTNLWCSINFDRLHEVSDFLLEECCSFSLRESDKAITERDAA